MKKMLKKISNKSGESLAETLVALLIAAFALVMLAGAITTTSKIIKDSSDKIEEYFKESNDNLVKMDGITAANPSETITITDDHNGKITFPVNVIYAESEKLKYKGKPVISFKSQF